MGNFYSDEMRYLVIKLKKCQNQTVPLKNGSVICQSSSAIDAHFLDEVFNVAFINTMFVLEDNAAPLQTFIDDQLFFKINPIISKSANFFVQESKSKIMDALFQFYEASLKSFFSIQTIRQYDDNFSNTDGSLVTIYMRSDRVYDQYERKDYDILTMLGDIGGLKEAFLAIGLLFVSFLTQKMFIS